MLEKQPVVGAWDWAAKKLARGGRMPESIEVPAIEDKDLRSFLTYYGMAEDMDGGKLECAAENPNPDPGDLPLDGRRPVDKC